MSTMQCSLLSLGCVFGCAPAQNQLNLTGLRALKIAQRRLRPEVRSKLMSVVSARSDASLSPEAWRFVFHDPATSGNSRVVTVAAKASSEHPDTVEAFSASKDESPLGAHPVAQGKLVIDSDKVPRAGQGRSQAQGHHRRAISPFPGPRHAGAGMDAFLYAEDEVPVVRIQVGAKTGSLKIINGDD